MTKRPIVLSVVFVVLIGTVGILLLLRSHSKTTVTQTEIQITASGFSPNTTIVKVGTRIVWKNVDAAPHAVASNPYPANSSLPGLRSRTILPQGSYSYVTTKAAVIQYHDNTQPTHNATIKVEE
jgi:plastocyanin